MCEASSRCTWVTADPLYLEYHDTEWGVPLADANALFECLTLEGAQAGLSWLTILRKREGYRRAFAAFDPAKIAAFGDDDVTRLLADPGIVRHRGKIEATVGNARAWIALQDSGVDPVEWLWSFVDGRPQAGSSQQASNTTSDQMSRALRKAGFRFVGSTTCYAFMQAVGMVNDHAKGCFRRSEVAQSAASFSL